MSSDDPNHENFEETLRAIAREVGRSVERAMSEVDLDRFAGTFGLDPDQARDWVENAGSWLRGQAEGVGDQWASHRSDDPRGPAEQEHAPAREPSQVSKADDPLRSAGPHPLDIPTEEQGVALAALDSGRWTVEPGTDALASQGDGPGPSDALGLVRELRARDWIAADGEVTLVGRRALARWLETTPPH
jgi:hypothetical protein